jgi:hypothetical protein
MDYFPVESELIKDKDRSLVVSPFMLGDRSFFMRGASL